MMLPGVTCLAFWAVWMIGRRMSSCVQAELLVGYVLRDPRWHLGQLLEFSGDRFLRCPC